MIPVTAAVAAITVAQEFDKRQLVLNATPGTPLAQLNDCFAFNTIDVVGATTYEPNAQVLADRSVNWNNRENNADALHTTTLDALSKDISVFVQSHLNFAKNTVRP